MNGLENLPTREKMSPIAAMRQRYGDTKHAEESTRHHWTRSKFKRAKTKAQRPRYTSP